MSRADLPRRVIAATLLLADYQRQQAQPRPRLTFHLRRQPLAGQQVLRLVPGGPLGRVESQIGCDARVSFEAAELYSWALKRQLRVYFLKKPYTNPFR